MRCNQTRTSQVMRCWVVWERSWRVACLPVLLWILQYNQVRRCRGTRRVIKAVPAIRRSMASPPAEGTSTGEEVTTSHHPDHAHVHGHQPADQVEHLSPFGE